MTTTVLTLEPAGFTCMQNGWLNGYATQAGNTAVAVDYPNSPSADNGTTGAANLDSALNAHTGPIVVFGHDMGAQVACKWLRDYGPTSTKSPSEVSFVLTGNPERKYGGATTVTSPPVTALYGGPGIPTSSLYPVTDFARQYDYFADYPNVVNPNPQAVANVSTGTLLIHRDYFSVGLNDAHNVSYTEGVITYITSPTYPLPALNYLWWDKNDQARLDLAQRPLVEHSYSRPAAVPAYRPTPEATTPMPWWWS